VLRSRYMRLAIGIWLCDLVLRTALAQAQPDVTQILKKVSETYKAASDYELIADTTTHEPGTNNGVSGHMLFAFRSPNHYRMEGAMPGLGLNDSEPGQAIIVHDGSAVWFYMLESNQYGSFPANKLTDDASDLGDLRPAAVDHFMMWRYRAATDFTASKFLREDAIEFSGAKVDCYVVSVSQKEGGFTYTWWVDKQRFRVLREDDNGSSSVFKTIKLDGPLPDEFFKFVPPPGAERIEVQR
jgi:outer membrane lipoprotein-sorting protein